MLVTLQWPYWSPSCGAAGLAFALIAEKPWVMRCGLRGSRRSYNVNINSNINSNINGKSNINGSSPLL